MLLLSNSALNDVSYSNWVKKQSWHIGTMATPNVVRDMSNISHFNFFFQGWGLNLTNSQTGVLPLSSIPNPLTFILTHSL